MGSYAFPVQPTAIKIKQVPIRVAIVIPLMGLLEEPISPTIREETVTKKAPNITTSKPISNFCAMLSPGNWGKNAINKTRPMLPNNTTLILRSLSVLNTSLVDPSVFFPILAKLPLKEETIVGIVFIKVINPPAATAPAPI